MNNPEPLADVYLNNRASTCSMPVYTSIKHTNYEATLRISLFQYRLLLKKIS